MPAIRNRSAAALCAFGLLAGTAASVHAQEVGFFEALFGKAREQAAPAPEVRPEAAAATAYRQRSRRVVRQEQKIKIRYAALPRSEPLSLKIGDRQKPLDMKAGPAAALMRDETLRPGDIVVLKTGARVFTGPPGKSHSMDEFEPAQNSRLIDKRTRQQLAAMVTPVGALPADEARKIMARMKRLTAQEKAQAQLQAPVAQQAAIRVIEPWRVAR